MIMSFADSPENADQKVTPALKKSSPSQHKPVDLQPSLQLSISSEKSEDSLDSGIYTRYNFSLVFLIISMTHIIFDPIFS